MRILLWEVHERRGAVVQNGLYRGNVGGGIGAGGPAVDDLVERIGAEAGLLGRLRLVH